MRVGVYGGSFNPIHFGHLRAAEEVREALRLDLVYFVPAASPPHKPAGDLAAAQHRLEMVRLGTKGNPHFMVSDTEVRRTGPSYSIDTVRHFLATLRGPNRFFVMMGSDQFAELDTWKDCNELVTLCSLIVHPRPREDPGAPLQVSLAGLKRFGYSKADDHYVHPSGQTLSFVETSLFPISASQIRSKLRERQSVRYLIPADVADYITRHQLY